VSPPKFTPRNYFSAAKEHLGIARQSLTQTQPQYFVAHYFAGLAVEEILRALSIKEGDTFDGTHSIEHWASKANVLSTQSNEKRDEIHSIVDEINARWRANHRYFTVKMLDAYLESTQLDKIRGDRVKYSSKRLFDLAEIIVGTGVEKWLSNNKSKKF
jgi:HEPN domain-containing protein